MSKVLIVEDSRALSRHLAHRLAVEVGVASDVASTLAEAEHLLRESPSGYTIALLDLTLPDAQDLVVVDRILAHRVPAVVFTGAYSDELRAQVLSRNVIDYVLKDGASELAYLVGLVRRFQRNQGIKVVVVDDSPTSRRAIAGLLRRHNYAVLEAADGPAALKLLEADADVKLVITDFHMPGMDGCELIGRIRQTHPRESLAIIGLSAGGGGTLSARFLKRGANDFLAKPFLDEEFYCRVQQNVEQIEHSAEIRDLTYRDPLTGLWNRRYFFEHGEKELARANQDGWPLSLAMIDVDHFKRVNDTLGHGAGDVALRHLASILAAHAAEGEIAARIGGEEFCLLSRCSGESAERHFESLRAKVAASPARTGAQEIPLTISIGTAHAGVDLDELVRSADAALYSAKTGGRNRVVRSVTRGRRAP